jgi:hypothetical protein
VTVPLVDKDVVDKDVVDKDVVDKDVVDKDDWPRNFHCSKLSWTISAFTASLPLGFGTFEVTSFEYLRIL